MYELALCRIQEVKSSELLIAIHILPLSWCVFGTVALRDVRDEERKTS